MKEIRSIVFYDDLIMGGYKEHGKSTFAAKNFSCNIISQPLQIYCIQLFYTFSRFIMETKYLSGDLENIWIIQPVNGGIRYVHNLPFLYFSLSLPWEYAPIKRVDYISTKTTGGEIYYTPSVSVTGYMVWGLEGLCLGDDERHQKPLVRTIVFGCMLTDGRYFVAETSPNNWARWQKMASKTFQPPVARSAPAPPFSWKKTSRITKAGAYIALFFVALSILGLIGEAVTNAIKTEWNHLPPPIATQTKVP